jgi:hypothetical protein
MNSSARPQLSQHAVSLYDFEAVCLGGTQEDLLKAITSQPAWMVDNNVAWESVARAEPDHHFVLGRTMVMESDSLRRVVRRLEQTPLNNVFTLEIQKVSGRPVLVIDRVGSTLRWKFSGNIPLVEKQTQEAREVVNSTVIRERKRQRVLEHERGDPRALAEALQAMKVAAHHNYIAAGEVALAAYAIHLGELRCGSYAERVRKFEENHPNLFGDAELIQEALFLGVGVFSADRIDVGRMASLLGIAHRVQ